jgi:hypothetical protein
MTLDNKLELCHKNRYAIIHNIIKFNEVQINLEKGECHVFVIQERRR